MEFLGRVNLRYLRSTLEQAKGGSRRAKDASESIEGRTKI